MKFLLILIVCFYTISGNCDDNIFKYYDFYKYNKIKGSVETNVQEQLFFSTLDNSKHIAIGPNGVLKGLEKISITELPKVIENEKHWLSSIFDRDLNIVTIFQSLDKFYIKVDGVNYYLNLNMPSTFSIKKPIFSGWLSSGDSEIYIMNRFKNSESHQEILKNLSKYFKGRDVDEFLYIQELIWRKDSLPKNTGEWSNKLIKDISLNESINDIYKVFGKNIEVKNGQEVLKDFLSFDEKNKYNFNVFIENFDVKGIDIEMIDSFKFSKKDLYKSKFAKIYFNSQGCSRSQMPIKEIISAKLHKDINGWKLESLMSINNLKYGVEAIDLSECEER